MKINLLYTFTLCLFLFATTTNAQNSLAVTVFHDLDGDGLAAGEPIITGVLNTELRLWQDNNNDGLIDGGDTEFMHDLGVLGVYTFGTGNVLPDANYILEYVETALPDAYYVTKMVSAVGLFDNDNDLDPMTDIAVFALSSPGDSPETFIDLGLVLNANIGSFVWEDMDGDGVQDGGAEIGLDGVSVTLLDAMTGIAVTNDIDFNPLTNPTATAGGGMYSFDNLPPGQYIVEFSVPAPSPDPWYPTTVTVNTDATDLTTDSDAEDNPAALNYLQSHTIILLSDEIDEENKIDAGFFQSANIGNFVWEDFNGNGTADVGEPGIDGVSVTLLDALTLAPIVNDADLIPLVNPATTAAGGFYTFDNLRPGEYIIEFGVPTPSPELWYPTTVTVNTDATDLMDDSDAENNSAAANYLQTHTIILLSDESDEEEKIDAGFFQASIIGDWVWEDLNGDGIQDVGEPPVPDGTMVSLIDENTGVAAIGADGMAIADQLTVAGAYQFMLVAPGDYRVQFSLPAPIGGVPWYPTEFDPLHTDADDLVNDSDANNISGDPNYLRSHVINIISNEEVNGNVDEDTRIDAGFWLPVKVGDNVFCDENGNGIDDDGVGGVGGVDVRMLYSSTGMIAQDAEGMDLMTTTVGGGMYMFNLVPPGFYILEFSFNASVPDPPFVFTVQDDPDGLGDDFTDSDVDPNPFGGAFGQTPEIEIISQEIEEEMKWDAGVYQEITIAGTIWLEDDLDYMNLNGELGPTNILVELIDFTNMAKVDDVLSNQGAYEFFNVAPGEYIIQFDITGSSIESATPCPGAANADDMVDNDDNGNDAPFVQTTPFTLLSNCDPNTPPIVEYIDFCYFFDCSENGENGLAQTACSEITPDDIICQIEILSTFCYVMPDENSPGIQPTPQLCPTGGAPHNISWFAFVAYGGNYSITVTPENCSGSTTGVEGVQIGLYTDCTFTETIYCDPSCNTNAVTFNSDGSGPNQTAPLEPGQVYYFFIDGCSGSVCSYEVDVSGSPMEPSIAPDDMCINLNGQYICDDAMFCPDFDINFEATGIDLTLDYTWTVTTLAGGPYDGLAQEITTDGMYTVSFANEGVYEVCLESMNNNCLAWTDGICRIITIEGLANEEFEDYFVCEEGDFTDLSVLTPMDPNGDGTIGWQGDLADITLGTNTHIVMTAEGCTYEQTFELLLFPESEDGLIDTILCKSELPFMVDNMLSITETAFQNGILIFNFADYLLIDETDQNMCDTFVDVIVEILDVGGQFLPADSCIAEGIILTFDFADSTSTNIGFLTFEWFDPFGDLIPDLVVNPGDPIDNIAPVAAGSGEYMLVITAEKDGKICTFEFIIDVDFDALFPPTPNISGDLEICESDSIVEYAAIDFGGASTFNWMYPADVADGTTSGMLGDTLTINWSGSAGGPVSLFTENGCGSSDTTVVTVSIFPQPTPVFNFVAEVCEDSCSTIEFIGDATGIIFDWDFDGGTEQNGTGSAGPGPHCVSWPDAGDKTVSLRYIDSLGCESTLALETINVVAPPDPPSVTCTSQLGEVVFTWDLIPGTVESDYSVIVTSGQTGGVLSGTTFTLGGLGVLEQVNITVVVQTNDACIEVVAFGTCVAQNCVPPTVSITAPGDITSFCLDGTDQSFNLIENIPMGVLGSGVFMGNGITDTLAGTFNPDSAAIGNNTIFYTFFTDDGCQAPAQLVIEILETPVASFFSDMDTICITGAFNLTYDGTAAVNEYMWDPGVDGTASTSGATPTITYTSIGLKTISLMVMKDGCLSESVSIDVFVQPVLDDIVISCSIQDINEVEFSWNDVAGATGYSVSVDGGPPFITTETTYGEMGLTPGDSVTIVVTVLTDSRCPGSMDQETCYAQDCPTFNFDLTQIDLQCVDGSNPTIPLATMAFGGMGGGDYTWSGSNVVGTPPNQEFDPNGLTEGPYQLNVIYEEGSCQGDTFMIVDILTTPTASFTVDATTICIGDTVNITYTGSQLTNQMISWSPAGLVEEGDVVGDDEYIAIFNTAGDFPIQLDVVNGMNGECTTTSANETITVEPELVFGAITCVPSMNEVAFSWDPVDCATNYEVFIDGVSQGVQTNTDFMVTGLDVGTEVGIEVMAISDCACADVPMTGVCETTECDDILLSLSTFDGMTNYCNTEDLGLIEILPIVDGTQGNSTDSWSGSTPGIVDQDGMFDPAVAGIGTHTIYYDFLETPTCPHVDSITITINEVPAVEAQFEPMTCYDQTTTLLEVIPSGGTGDYTISLDGEDAGLMNDVGAGEHTIVVTDGNGCEATTSVSIVTPAEPNPSIAGSTQIELGDSSSYTIESLLIDSMAIDSIIWMANGTELCNDPACFSLENQMPTENTIYDVTVYYNSGCSVTTSLTVEVVVIEPPLIFIIPNILSPNGDGENDEWQFVTNNDSVIVNSIKVFDRWGSQVWGFTGPISARDNAPIWDGKYKGQTLQPGVYVYVVDYNDDRRTHRIRSGDITIIN